MVFTRKGVQLAGGGNFKSLREAAVFPKTTLRSLIADKVWLDLARGDLPDAVFVAFRTVEGTVRDGGEDCLDRRRNNLMRKAFDKANGPHVGRKRSTTTGKSCARAMK